jgi:hypothetical protein
MSNKTKPTATQTDFCGQIREVKVATDGSAADYGVKTIKSDRSGDALRRVLPPTPLSGDCKKGK